MLDYILHVYVKFCYMDVRLSQLNKTCDHSKRCDTKMLRWIFNARTQEKISVQELRLD